MRHIRRGNPYFAPRVMNNLYLTRSQSSSPYAANPPTDVDKCYHYTAFQPPCKAAFAITQMMDQPPTKSIGIVFGVRPHKKLQRSLQNRLLYTLNPAQSAETHCKENFRKPKGRRSEEAKSATVAPLQKYWKKYPWKKYINRELSNVLRAVCYRATNNPSGQGLLGQPRAGSIAEPLSQDCYRACSVSYRTTDDITTHRIDGHRSPAILPSYTTMLQSMIPPTIELPRTKHREQSNLA